MAACKKKDGTSKMAVMLKNATVKMTNPANTGNYTNRMYVQCSFLFRLPPC